MEIGFLEITLLDVLDVLIVGFLMFQIYKLLKGSLAFSIFLGLVLIYVLWWLVDILNMDMLSLILNQVVSVGVILLLIVFQPEVRRFLLILGKSLLRRRPTFLNYFVNKKSEITKQQRKEIQFICEAVDFFSQHKIGALIIFARNPKILGLSNYGILIDANISTRLLETIFYGKNPLHDGALIISKGKIYSASAVLPISENKNLPRDIGLRHRAAVGMTENANVLALAVSEETGTISTAQNGNLYRNISVEVLGDFLKKEFGKNR
jgi:diadenylate cyclase